MKPIKDLGPGYFIFGNKGNVWSNTAHAYKSGHGNLCNTPALSTNHARIEGIDKVGCPRCLEEIAKLADCSICGESYGRYGNNAEPVNGGRCCDSCNLEKVIPARLSAAFNSN